MSKDKIGGKRGRQAEMGPKIVAWDDWGKEIHSELVYDKDGTVIGSVDDSTRYITEPDIRPVTKKDVLADIDSYWNDFKGERGWMVDDDVSIYIAYENGDFVDIKDLGDKKFKRRGIVGLSVMTGDYEMVWGGEVNKRTGKVEPWPSWTPEGENEGPPNVYSGYKATGIYKERARTTYERTPSGRPRTKREVLQRTPVIPLDN